MKFELLEWPSSWKLKGRKMKRSLKRGLKSRNNNLTLEIREEKSPIFIELCCLLFWDIRMNFCPFRLYVSFICWCLMLDWQRSLVRICAPYDTNHMLFFDPLQSQLTDALLFSRPVVSNSLWPCGLQHTRPPCPSPSPEVCPSLYPLRQWCHPAISSSDTLFFCS